MLSPAEVGYDLTLYAGAWLEERLRLTRALAKAVTDHRSPRALHDLRVACRRLREAIAFFDGVPEIPPLFDVDRAARAMARSVRRLRELDVARKRLAELDLPPDRRVERLRKKLGEALKKRRRQVATKRSARIEKRSRKLVAVIDENLPLRTKLRAPPPDPGRESDLLVFVEGRGAEKRALVEGLFGNVRPSGGEEFAEPSSERLHEVRVAIKHWRYATEIGRAVMPRVLYRPMAMRLRRLQELGGYGQDLADLQRIAERELDRLGVSPSPSRRLLVASIRAARRIAAAQFVAALTQRLPPVETARTG